MRMGIRDSARARRCGEGCRARVARKKAEALESPRRIVLFNMACKITNNGYGIRELGFKTNT